MAPRNLGATGAGELAPAAHRGWASPDALLPIPLRLSYEEQAKTSDEVGVHTSKPPVGQIRGRTRSNVAFRVAEERWRQLFGNSIVGITLFDREFHFIDASPTFQKMVGYSCEELRQFTPLDISVEGEREINRTLFLELQQGHRQNY